LWRSHSAANQTKANAPSNDSSPPRSPADSGNSRSTTTSPRSSPPTTAATQYPTSPDRPGLNAYYSWTLRSAGNHDFGGGGNQSGDTSPRHPPSETPPPPEKGEPHRRWSMFRALSTTARGMRSRTRRERMHTHGRRRACLSGYSLPNTRSCIGSLALGDPGRTVGRCPGLFRLD
jgi:hypothetical protein